MWVRYLVFLQLLEADELKELFVRGLEVDIGGEAGLVGLDPSDRAEAPSVSWGKSWEAVHGGGLGQIVSSLFGEC